MTETTRRGQVARLIVTALTCRQLAASTVAAMVVRPLRPQARLGLPSWCATVTASLTREPRAARWDAGSARTCDPARRGGSEKAGAGSVLSQRNAMERLTAGGRLGNAPRVAEHHLA